MYKSGEEHFEGDEVQQLQSTREKDLFKLFGIFTDRPGIVLFDVNPHDGE